MPYSSIWVGGCTTKTVTLEKLVGTHLGLPLDKGNSRVRWNSWCRKVLSLEQRAYAVIDAYARLMTYHWRPAGSSWTRCRPSRFAMSRRRTKLLLQLDGEDDALLSVIIVADFYTRQTDNVLYCGSRARYKANFVS